MKRIGALRGMMAWLVLLPLGAAAWAQDVGEGVRVERVLTADQIDSSTVDVGAFVVVVYGQGERHPVSGAWTQLDTARGSIQTVSRRSLILSLERDGGPGSIAVECIQTLRLVDDHAVHRPIKTPSQRSADQETTSMTRRIISKLVMGDLSRSVSSARDSTQVDSGYAKSRDQDSGRGKRIAGQLIVGTFIAVVIFYMFSGFFFGVPGL